MSRKMRWDCERLGCFNVKARPKIELFDRCFPGKIGFGDVDAMVEINAHFLFLEWKRVGQRLPAGQRIAYERLTAGGNAVVVVVEGDAETTIPQFRTRIAHGQVHDRRKTDFDDFFSLCLAWANWAKVK